MTPEQAKDKVRRILLALGLAPSRAMEERLVEIMLDDACELHAYNVADCRDCNP